MGIILSFLSSNWRTVGTLLIVAIAFITAGVYRGLYHHEKTLYTALKQEIEAQSKAAEAHTKAVEAQQLEITKGLKDSYDADLKKLRAYYASHPNVEWMPNAPPECVLPIIPDTPKGTDGKTKGAEPAAPRIEVNPLDAADDVLKLLKLQEWIRQQTMVK